MDLRSYDDPGAHASPRSRGATLTRAQRTALRVHTAARALHAWTPARIALHPLAIAIAATVTLVVGAPSAAVLAVLVQIGLAIWIAQQEPPRAPSPAPPRRARAAALPPLVAITPAPDDRAAARAALRLPPARAPRRADPDRRLAVQDQAVALAARVAAVGIRVHVIAIGDADGDWVAWALVGAEPLLVRAVIYPAPARTAVLPDSDPTHAWIVTTTPPPPPPPPDALLAVLLERPPAAPPPPAPPRNGRHDPADPGAADAPPSSSPAMGERDAAAAAPEADAPGSAADAPPSSSPATGERDAADAAPEADGGRRSAAIVAATLTRFGVAADVAWVRSGPALHVVGLALADGVSVRRVEALRDDLALALATPKVRVAAPVDGPYVAVEIPRADRRPVALRDLWHDPAAAWDGDLPVPLGRDGGGAPIIIDLAAQPHILVAGATGSGKSMLLHAWLTTLLQRLAPDAARVALIDLKQVELAPRYGGAPHLWDAPATTEEAATALLRRLVAEMEARYAGLQQRGLRDLGAWRAVDPAAPPRLLLVVDEIADLLATDPSGAAATAVRALTRKARAAGIHLALATQRPSVDVLAGEIKANIPARVALALPTATDSQVALGQAGAETLLGAGDLLYRSPDGALIRVQAPLVAWDDGAWPPDAADAAPADAAPTAPTPDDLARRSGLLIHPDAAVRAAWLQRMLDAARAAGAHIIMADPARVGDAPGDGETPLHAARALATLALLARQRAAVGVGADAPWVILVIRGLEAHLAAWRAHAVARGARARSVHALAQAALVETLAAHPARVAAWLVAATPPDPADLAPAVWDALRRHGWTLAPRSAMPAPLDDDGRIRCAGAPQTLTLLLDGAAPAAPPAEEEGDAWDTHAAGAAP